MTDAPSKKQISDSLEMAGKAFVAAGLTEHGFAALATLGQLFGGLRQVGLAVGKILRVLGPLGRAVILLSLGLALGGQAARDALVRFLGG